jgi:cytosolic iron-sulfur assembly component 2
MDIQNANPTILTAAQLPTRETKRRIRRNGPDTRYNDAIFAKPAYFSSPLEGYDDALYAGWFGGGGGGDGLGDDFTEEPIDEQEIYGEPPLSFNPNIFP